MTVRTPTLGSQMLAQVFQGPRLRHLARWGPKHRPRAWAHLRLGSCTRTACLMRRGVAPSDARADNASTRRSRLRRVATEIATKTGVLAILKPVLRSKWAFEPGQGAEGGTRTPTPLRAPAPKAGVSAVSPLPREVSLLEGVWRTRAGAVRRRRRRAGTGRPGASPRRSAGRPADLPS